LLSWPQRDLLKVIWHDGQGACLFTKRLERGRFLWPSAADGVVTISPSGLVTCCQVSTGVIRRKLGIRPLSANRFCLRIAADVIPASHERCCRDQCGGRQGRSGQCTDGSYQRKVLIAHLKLAIE
jgi:hypothetical protein